MAFAIFFETEDVAAIAGSINGADGVEPLAARMTCGCAASCTLSLART